MNELFELTSNAIPPLDMVEKLRSENKRLELYLYENIYNNNNTDYINSVKERFAETASLHAEKNGNNPAYLLRAPGRLNAFLEYLDMACGDHMSTTIDGDIPLCITPREDDIVRVVNINPDFETVEFSIKQELDNFKRAAWDADCCKNLEDNWDNRTLIYPHFGHPKGHWVNYILSSYLRIAWLVDDNIHGANLTFGKSTIPPRGGTSSSSALVVLSFLACYLSNKDTLPNWSADEVCRLLGEAEWYVGTHGGANDQTTILRNRVNCILYNRHSQNIFESTILPSLQGVKFIVAHSLWEANKSLGALHSFNLRKGWMDIGSDILEKIIYTVCDYINQTNDTASGYINRAVESNLNLTVSKECMFLDSAPLLWKIISENFNKLGSLDEIILDIPNEAIVDLIRLLPSSISPQDAAKLLNKNINEIERDYTLPYPNQGGYKPRAAARFFHTENIIGREIEQILIEADSKLNSGQISISSPEYIMYQKEIGEMLERLQETLRDDFNVSNHQLELLLNIAKNGPGYLGGKLTGAGNGGCVSIMVLDGYENDFCSYLDVEYYSKDALFDDYRNAIITLDREIRDELQNNLDNALKNHALNRRPVTFSAGACAVEFD